jgi:hypothetical protein
MITDTPEQEVALSVGVQFQYCAAALEWFYRGFPRECAVVRCAQIKGCQLLHVKFLSDSNLFRCTICRSNVLELIQKINCLWEELFIQICGESGISP